MKKEDYVSLEVAKLLKEKGFDKECEYYISANTSQVFNKGRFKPFKEEGHEVFLCPTLYEAQKWLRTSYRILITPTYLFNDKYTYHILRMDAGNIYCHNYNQYDSYEEALNEGVLEALKLI